MKKPKNSDETPRAVIEVHVRHRSGRGMYVRIMAPVMLVLALGAGYVILTYAVTSLAALREPQPGVEDPVWATVIWNLAEVVDTHQQKAIPAIVVAGIGAAVLAFVSRSLAYLIYLFALFLVILDILILAGALATVWSDLFRDVGAL